MTSFINRNKTPNFFLMHYSNEEWVVKNLFLIPKFFVSSSIIERRNPLRETARRSGWVGCNILLDRIPEEGRISVIKDEKAVDRNKVQKSLIKMNFLNRKDSLSRGWTSDVLKCVNDIKKEEFGLDEVYRFSSYLKELHPENNNVEAKIRQQLQELRDRKIIQFLSPGRYRKIS